MTVAWPKGQCCKNKRGQRRGNIYEEELIELGNLSDGDKRN